MYGEKRRLHPGDKATEFTSSTVSLEIFNKMLTIQTSNIYKYNHHELNVPNNFVHSNPIRDILLSELEVERLADSLLDGTVFGIITELKDIQSIELNKLSKDRQSIVLSYQVYRCNTIGTQV